MYVNHRWGDKESVSGTGSKLEQTRKLTEILPGLFLQYNIQSVLDIPCGDFNWMRHVDVSCVRYSGADIVKPLIEKNRQIVASPNIDFFVADIIESRLPSVDLILCRDCFVHFSHKHIFKAIANIKTSNSGFLLTTTFPSHANFDIVTGSWRPINLEKKPFSFPHPLEIINEEYHSNNSGIADKSLALWRISDLP
jgi:SAM-dependent methyltransferase